MSSPGNLYTALVSRILFPMHECAKGQATVPVRKALEASQWWPAERLEDFRLGRLRAFLEHVQSHVPYYRDVFRRTGFDPSGLRSIADLAQVPLLTKQDIRSNLAALKSEQARSLARFNTGGSSGEPLVFFIGKERVSHDVAAKWRATRWWGVDIGDPEIVVWGSPIELGAQDRLRGLRDRVLRSRLLPAFDMSDARLEEFVRTIRAMRPRMLFGYPSALVRIAAFARERGQRLDDLGTRVAFVTAERLYDHQRATIAGAYGCSVANGYGGRDAGFVAHECPAGRMHITAEDIVVETIGADGTRTRPGEAGEIVMTHLATRDFPFIRYRTGDFGILDDVRCECGRGLPVMKEIQGRATDFVVAADGTVMHGLALVYVIRDLPGVKQFKIVQESRERTRVLLVPDGGFDAATERTITTGLRARLGRDVDVSVELVGDIAAEVSGKYRYVVSNVAADRPHA